MKRQQNTSGGGKAVELAEQYRAELVAKHVPAGSAVLSVRRLAEKYGIACSTADRILQILADQEFIRRTPRSGSVIVEDPPERPCIGFCGFTPEPYGEEFHRVYHCECMMREFARHGIEPRYIPYHTLADPVRGEVMLEGLNGLIVDYAFTDEKTLPLLRRFCGKIVLTNSRLIHPELNCLQVVTDFRSALEEVHRVFDLTHYDRIVLVRANNRNALALEKIVRDFLQQRDVREPELLQLSPELPASGWARLAGKKYFSEHRENDPGTLYVSLSEYFAQGMLDAYGRGSALPEVLTFDNHQGHYPGLAPEKTFFTAIDPDVARLCREEVALLVRHITSGDDRTEVLRIPAQAVIRHSMKQPVTKGS